MPSGEQGDGDSPKNKSLMSLVLKSLLSRDGKKG